MNRFIKIIFICFSLVSVSQAKLIDGVHVSYGIDDNSEHTIKAGRISIMQKWHSQWLTAGNWHLTGYWELSYAHLNHDAHSGQKERHGNMLAFTPVFVYASKQPWFSHWTPFVEAGIGATLIEDTRIGNRILSTAFQFEDRLGAGFTFGSEQQFMAKYNYIHYSNGSIKRPNQGLNMQWLTLGYYF